MGAPRKSGATARIRVAIAAALAIAVVIVSFLLNDRFDTRATSTNLGVRTGQVRRRAGFLDLTEQMDQEYLADGLTEDLIDKLSKVPGIDVPAPRSSFFFKDTCQPILRRRANGVMATDKLLIAHRRCSPRRIGFSPAPAAGLNTH
jgi:hypothetical protein